MHSGYRRMRGGNGDTMKANAAVQILLFAGSGVAVRDAARQCGRAEMWGKLQLVCARVLPRVSDVTLPFFSARLPEAEAGRAEVEGRRRRRARCRDGPAIAGDTRGRC